MPSAVSKKATKRIDLKSLPGGFIEIRKFDYGESLQRRDLGVSMHPGERPSDRASVNVHYLDSQAFEFKTAIIDHNLEDENGRKLNFSRKEDVINLQVDIALEMEEAINSFNELPGEPSKSEPEPNPNGRVDTSSKESGPLQQHT